MTSIYVSGGPTSSKGQHSCEKLSNFTFKNFDGYLIRISWSDLEKSPGVYDFSLLTNEIARAKEYGKLATVAVVNGGPGAPSWLESDGISVFNYSFHGQALKMPIPWDTQYLYRWTNFVQALGATIATNTTVDRVHCTHSTANGFEMQLPGTLSNWQQVGYTESLLIDSWKNVLDAYDNAFFNSTAILDIELHPVLKSNNISQSVSDYAKTLDIYLFGSWFSKKNTTNYSYQWNLMKNSVGPSVQLMASYTKDPSQFSDGGLQATIDCAWDGGVRYFEPWDSDLKNSALTSLWQALKDRV